MSKLHLKLILVSVFILILSFVTLGWGSGQGTSVTSEPLICYSLGEKMVCFDEMPNGDVACGPLDVHTILCKALD